MRLSRKKIVAIAFTCEPNKGSEYEVGWRWTQLISDQHDLIALVKSSSYRHLLARQFNHKVFGPVKKVGNCIYKEIDIPFVGQYLTTRLFMRLHYIIWQFLVLFWLLQRSKLFDICHHVCFVCTWIPPIAAFASTPFIWGPIGTGSKLPDWLPQTPFAKCWSYFTQSFPRHNPLVDIVTHRAAKLIPINEYVSDIITNSGLRVGAVRKISILASIATDIRTLMPSNKYSSIETATILWSGRDVPYKMPQLVALFGLKIKAKYPHSNFIMIGDGLHNLASCYPSLSIRSSVPQDEFHKLLSKAQILLNPTTEGAGLVTLEAMSYGVPIVCIENSGPAFFCDQTAGLACEVAATIEGTADNLLYACQAILRSEQVWRSFSDASYKHHCRYTWSKLGQSISELYESL
jgi:glycosyltransferase involved in cell wall biosynthesis